MMDFVKKHYWLLSIFGLSVVYLVTHLLYLTKLPVFADEAIYIRWSQLIIDDWRQYLFFPLNDGKTPLQMWVMVPFLKMFEDPLFAGRLVSVLAGLIQLFVIKEIIQQLGGKRFAQFLGMALVTFLPFWFFFQRMALIDGLLTLLLSMTFLGLIRISTIRFQVSDFRFQLYITKHQSLITWVVITGVSFGLALLTKPSAIFFASVFPVMILLRPIKRDFIKSVFFRSLPVACAGLIGLSIFFSLKLHPAFGQLFSRGSDFSFSTTELIQGQWRASISNIDKVFDWNGTYISYSLIMLSGASVMFAREKRKYLVTLLAIIVFVSPFIILGRVFHPRYILPMNIFTTVLTALFLEEMLHFPYKSIKPWFAVFIFLLSPLLLSARFMIDAYTGPDNLQLVSIDREQYLEEWSSGHGIYQATDVINQYAENGTVLVLTEGYFGTLPDGLLMYFHNKDVTNIEIQGIGAPVTKIPDEMIEKFDTVEDVLLVVNSHRMNVGVEEQGNWELIESYPRPNGAPSLEVYRYNK